MGLDLVGEEQLGLRGLLPALSVGTEQLSLEGLQLGGVDIQRRDGQKRGGLGAAHVDGRGRDLPRERNRLGRVVDRLVALLRGRSLAAVQDVQLVAAVLTRNVVADLGAVNQSEGDTVLLTDLNTLGQLGRAVASLELVGVGVSLDRALQLLSREQRQVQDVVGVEVSSLGALGLL